jgi:Domain of unknown function (DUF4383)
MRPAERRAGVAAETIINIVLGTLLLAYGLIALLLGGNELSSEPGAGTVDGERWLGIEGNGWTNLLFMAVGVLLIAGSPRRLSAKAVALIGGLVLGAAAVIAMVDGDDVFGVFAANATTIAAWAVVAGVLLVSAFAPAPRRRVDSIDPLTGIERKPAERRFDRTEQERDHEPGRRQRR